MTDDVDRESFAKALPFLSFAVIARPQMVDGASAAGSRPGLFHRRRMSIPWEKKKREKREMEIRFAHKKSMKR